MVNAKVTQMSQLHNVNPIPFPFFSDVGAVSHLSEITKEVIAKKIDSPEVSLLPRLTVAEQ